MKVALYWPECMQTTHKLVPLRQPKYDLQWSRTETYYMLLQDITAAAAASLQSCLTLCHPIDSSPLGSSVPGILQARILEWVAISFSNAWKWKVKGKSLSCAWLLVTTWTAAYQNPRSMGFSRQEYWSGGAIAFSVRFDYLSKISAFCLRLDYAAKMCPNPRWLILNWILRREWRFLLQKP